jgi:hypothetical protein
MEAKIAARCVVRVVAWTERWKSGRLVKRVCAVFAIALLSCTDLNVTVVDVTQITIEPPSLTLAVGDSANFTATLRDDGGNVLTGRAVSWSSSNSIAVTVGSDGSVIALAAGDATIRASSEGEQAEANVSVPQPPIIAVQPAAATFRVPAGGPPPASIQVAIRNDGTGTLDDLTTTVVYNAGEPGGWLTVTLESTNAPTTLTLAAAPGGLAHGIYTAAVAVSSPTSIPSSQTVTVVLDILEPSPSIALAATEISFTASDDGSDPAPRTVAITNSGGGALTGVSSSITYASGQPSGWLSASLSSTTAPATVTLQAATGSLAAGAYNATLEVTSGVASNSPQAVDITFTVTAAPVPPTIGLSPTNVTFNATAGGGDPGASTVAVTNTGGETLTGLSVSLTYASGQPGAWLTASLDQTTAPATLNMQALTGSLGAGTYNATVSVASPAASNSPQTVSVTFTVAPAPLPPAIGLSTTNVAFSGTAGAGNPSNQTVSVTNTGGGILDGLSSTITYASGQPTGWLNTTLSGTTAPATVTLQATTGALAPGDYSAAVSVAASVASNSPQTVDVTFTVTTLPAIGLSRATVTVNAIAGGGDPSTETVAITNTGGGTLTGLSSSVSYVSGTPGWLTATLNATTAPATLSLQAATGALGPATYVANVTVTSGVATNSPQTISVTFTVAPVSPPAAPTNLNANGQRNAIRLTWNDNSNDEQSFEVQRNTTGVNGPWDTIASLPANTTDFRDRNYVEGVTYWYRVLACNAAGCSSSNVDTGSN